MGDKLIRHVRHVGTCRAMSELSISAITDVDAVISKAISIM